MFRITPGQFQYIVSQIPQSVLGQFLVALLISPMLFDSGFPEIKLYLWLLCFSIVLLYRQAQYRISLFKRDFRSAPPGTRLVATAFIGLILTSLLWSVLFAKVLTLPANELHFLSVIVSIGLISVAIGSVGVSFKFYLAYVIPILLSEVVGLLLLGENLYITLAMLLLVGGFFTMFTAWKYSHHFTLMQKMTQQLEETELEALLCLGKAGEYRDSDTGDHVLRVGYSSYLLAKASGLNEYDAKNLMLASPLHDLGKIGIPDQILLKPGELTTSELETMKRHTRIGAEILKNSQTKVMQVAKVVALSHHEKWDGTGYPNNLVGEAIPIEGRIVAICDVFDALTSSRPYKKRWKNEEAIEHLREKAGTHFDPRLVELFIPLIPEILNFSYRLEDHESATGAYPIIQSA